MATKHKRMPNVSRKPKPKASSGGYIARCLVVESYPVLTARLTAKATASEPGSNTPLASSSTCGANRTVRYRGLDNNAAQLVTLFALANLYLVRRLLSS